MEFCNYAIIAISVAFNHAIHRIGEPIGKLFPRPKDVWHEKVKKRPKLHQTILQRSTSQKQSPLRIEVYQRLPPLALKVFNILCLVQNQVVPLLSFEGEGILDDKLIRCDDYMVPIGLMYNVQ
jgi:hypothetical protein